MGPRPPPDLSLDGDDRDCLGPPRLDLLPSGENGAPSSPPTDLRPVFGRSADGAVASAAPPPTPGQSDDGLRASGPSTEAGVSEAQAVTEDCDGYDEPVTLAYGIGGPSKGGQAATGSPLVPTGGTAAALLEVRPPHRHSLDSPSSHFSLDDPWTRSLVCLKLSELSNALRPLAAGSGPLEDDASLLPDEFDHHLSGIEVPVGGTCTPPLVGGGSTGALTMRCSFPGLDETSHSSPSSSARSLANGSGRFRLNRTRSSLVRALGVAPRAAAAEPPLGEGPAAGRLSGPLRATSFSVDLGAPLRGGCFLCACEKLYANAERVLFII